MIYHLRNIDPTRHSQKLIEWSGDEMPAVNDTLMIDEEWFPAGVFTVTERVWEAPIAKGYNPTVTLYVRQR